VYIQFFSSDSTLSKNLLLRKALALVYHYESLIGAEEFRIDLSTSFMLMALTFLMET
jgi:hypothetical protein